MIKDIELQTMSDEEKVAFITEYTNFDYYEVITFSNAVLNHTIASILAKGEDKGD